MIKPLFFIEWLITQEMSGLGYKFIGDDEKLKNNRKVGSVSKTTWAVKDVIW